ncbi:4-deoxy-L-threo-5-hexosulose-uronate ketol-isomerase [Vibrio variabilis]|uniref:5-dehydro-4-deoxy-D-glucuronate isomerase n=1 Tax=Vibrio variabilis TaxID=990271 RepID=A0ABQ0JGF7_9VIBR|nr:4-deoxy-L-threo-5-hexosulose-uronate ketol-isomerase [Vibrio variabilis]
MFGTDFFLQRRELGIINLGGEATITVDGNQFSLNNLDALYIGKGREDVTFSSADNCQPARLYCLSAPAHAAYKTRIIRRDEANQIHLGDADSANVRTINQYIHPDILETSQLSMGITHLAPGSVWNTMPAHTHERRMEATSISTLMTTKWFSTLWVSQQKRDTSSFVINSWCCHQVGRSTQDAALKTTALFGEC